MEPVNLSSLDAHALHELRVLALRARTSNEMPPEQRAVLNGEIFKNATWAGGCWPGKG